eukprot:TRINITY_DN42612_c0_g1_i1.p1 TRINITY_DN42612_c0_g1~~TRINITY_DN42612_c0_g1_i1.p1  ORF type:complete len:774 (+),score=221.76 TRINITY_DN42612_c0_g1_i1:104-2425(+)
MQFPGLLGGLPGLNGGMQAKAGGLPNLTGLPGALPGLAASGLVRPPLGGLPGGLPGVSLGGLPPNLAGLTGLPGLAGSLPGGALGMLPGKAGMPGLGRPTMPLAGLSKPFAAKPPTIPLPGSLQALGASTSKASTPATPGKQPVPAGPLTAGPLAAGPLAASGTAQPCTVYVGRISTEVSDDFVKGLLEKCGKVSKWNRAADPNTSKLTSFGFCDFEEPQAVWRALEFLHEQQLCDKKLLVKCEEKAKQTMDKWKESQREDLTKGKADDKKTDGGKADSEKKTLTDAELTEELKKQSETVEKEIAKMLEGKNKGYPVLGNETEADKKASEDEDKKAKEALEKAKQDGDKSKAEGEKEKENDSGNKRKSSPGRGRDDDRGKRRRDDDDDNKKSAVSHRYRPSRRERDREARYRDRERDIEKEYSYRLREFERNEEKRIRNLKQDLRDLEPAPEPSEREKQKFVDRDLNWRGDADERDWKRRREDRAKEQKREQEKDAADRAAETEEIEAEKRRKKQEKEEKERKEAEEAERIRKEKEEVERKKREEERREREEKERKEREAREEEERKEREAREERERKEREIREEKERKEREAREADQKKQQADAAARLMASVQAEIMSAPAAKSAPSAAVQAAFRDDQDVDEKGNPRKHKPLTRLEDGPTERKLKEDEMRRLIGQVPTDKAKAFAFNIDWDAVHSNNIIEKKLRPWVKKKVTEYLGAEEQGMIEFIMRKVSAHEKPDKILAELEGFLDEEAENFTLKMWRMLIFEVLRVKAR